MSATDQMRAMLDQLMGTSRDGEEAKKHKLNFTDGRVCKSFLLDCCPHDILASTVSIMYISLSFKLMSNISPSPLAHGHW